MVAEAGTVTSTSVSGGMLPEDLAVNPYKFNLRWSSWITGPSYVTFALFSAYMFYIIYRNCRKLMKVFFSVLLYLVAQLLLLITLTASWITEQSQKQKTEKGCRLESAFQTFAMLLPGYCIVIITLVRCIFLKFPFSHMIYLKIKFQLLGLAIVVIICSLISALPSLKLCETKLYETFDQDYKRIAYCSYADKSLPSCKIFYGILVGGGFVLPFVVVCALYLYIYNIVLTARRSHLRLVTNSSQEIQSVVLKEGKSVPWSIIAILFLCFLTTMPWAIMTVLTKKITEAIVSDGNISTLFDLFYSILQVFIGVSPLVYIVTTTSLRQISWKLFRKMVSFEWCSW